MNIKGVHVTLRFCKNDSNEAIKNVKKILLDSYDERMSKRIGG